jgi:outer membrane receptor for ferrienterochelin and colicin
MLARQKPSIENQASLHTNTIKLVLCKKKKIPTDRNNPTDKKLIASVGLFLSVGEAIKIMGNLQKKRLQAPMMPFGSLAYCLFWLLGVSVCFFISSAFSQSAVQLEGIVYDRQSRQPLAGVNVFLIDTHLGDVTDSTGHFEISGIPPGQYRLRATMIGYEPAEIGNVKTSAGERRRVELMMAPTIIEMSEVTVEALRQKSRQEMVSASVHALSPRRAKNLAGGGEDVFRALQTIPGIISRSDFNARLFIRGGRPDQNLVLMDGVSVYDPYRLFGLVSMFNPETVAEVKVLAGGFPANYGDRLSAVLDIENRAGSDKSPFRANINTSLTNANFVIEGRIPGRNEGSWIFSSRRTYYDLILSNLTDVGSFPNFFDVQGKVNLATDPAGTLDVTFVKSRERTDILATDEDAENEQQSRPDSIAALDRQDQVVVGLRHRRLLSSRLSGSTLLSYYRNGSYSDFGVRFPLGGFIFTAKADLQTTEAAFRQDFAFALSAQHTLDFGFTLARQRAQNRWEFFTDNPAFIFAEVLRFTEHSPASLKSGAYLQDLWQISPRLMLQPGLRWDYSSFVDQHHLSPRLNLMWEANPLTRFRFAAGLYSQFPSYETLQGDGFRVSLQNVKSLGIGAERSVHFLASVERKLTHLWTFRVDGYYKSLRDLLFPQQADTTWLVVTERDSASVRTELRQTKYFTFQPKNNADGFARGLEILLEKRHDAQSKLSGWLGYAYALVRGTEPDNGRFFLRYDQRHTITAVAEWRLGRKWQIDARFQAGSGFPYYKTVYTVEVVEDVNRNGRLEVYEDRNLNGQLDPGEDRNGNGKLDTVNPETGIPDERTVEMSDDSRNRVGNARLPWTSRLDARLSYLPRFWGANWIFYLDVINLYNRKNVQEFNYDPKTKQDEPIYGIPLVPTIGVSVKF